MEFLKSENNEFNISFIIGGAINNIYYVKLYVGIISIR